TSRERVVGREFDELAEGSTRLGDVRGSGFGCLGSTRQAQIILANVHAQVRRAIYAASQRACPDAPASLVASVFVSVEDVQRELRIVRETSRHVVQHACSRGLVGGSSQ